MPIKDFEQPQIISIDINLRLRTTDIIDWDIALPWYQNPKVLYYSEGVTGKVYNLETINRMYQYLSEIGELYFIEILEDGIWRPIGDVTLSEENFPIAIGDEKYWGKGIGKKVIYELIKRAKLIGLAKIHIPAIYIYNKRSQKLFESMGFVEINEDITQKSYELSL